LGGDNSDPTYGIAVDATGSVYVTGATQSSNWTSGGFDLIYGGGQDAFVVKLSAGGEHVWSTYLGDSSLDSGNGIAIDVSGNVYVTGTTYSPDWTNGGFDLLYNGGGDAFVAQLSAGGAHLWSTYLGGSDRDEGLGIAVDASARIYVTGVHRVHRLVDGWIRHDLQRWFVRRIRGRARLQRGTPVEHLFGWQRFGLES
jgi:hypothetical protein